MLYYKKILIIIVISLLILSSCTNDIEMRNEKSDNTINSEKFNILNDLSVENIKSVTISTQMTENPPGKITINNEDEIKLIINVFKEAKYQLNEATEDSNGWLFLIAIENKNNEKMIISVQKNIVKVNGKYYKIFNNISERLLQIYNNIN